jgi:hypothetical protein
MATPDSHTNPATQLRLTAPKVQPTMETPNNHHGIDRPPRKYSAEFLPALIDATQPMERTIKKKTPIIIQSIVLNSIISF